MAAFDITTKPTSLNLKPGTTGSILVVVSNRLGRPVIGLVKGVITPASAAKWLMSPPDLQRRYEADPAATATYEFKVTVPKGTPAQPVQFVADIRDLVAPDDSQVQGQTVNINVTPDDVVVTPGPGIKWWVWAIAAAVLLVAGGVLFLLLRPKGVPNVVGKPVQEAIAKMEKAGFAPVTLKDTLRKDGKVDAVVGQEPKAKSELPSEKEKGKKPATLVVKREPTVVPGIKDQSLALAIERLREAGLRVGGNTGLYTSDAGQNDKIASVTPVAGDTVARGSAVNLVIYAYSATPPVVCPNVRLCYLEPKVEWRERTGVLRDPNTVIIPR